MVSELSSEQLNAVIQRLYPDASLGAAERLTGGVSADVFKLTLNAAGETQPLVLRIHGATHSGHPAQLEYDLLHALRACHLPVAQVLNLDASGTIIQAPYLIMSFEEGSTKIASAQAHERIEKMAGMLKQIHRCPTTTLPDLPLRLDPLPEVLDFLPEESEWHPVKRWLETVQNTAYTNKPALLHGDYWPENLLWKDGEINTVLDWEDAAIGDPISDVAAASVELRYLFGTNGMQQFLRAYTDSQPIEPARLALWHLYVAAAAHKYMSEWRLEPAREAHMREQCLITMREATQTLLNE